LEYNFTINQIGGLIMAISDVRNRFDIGGQGIVKPDTANINRDQGTQIQPQNNEAAPTENQLNTNILAEIGQNEQNIGINRDNNQPVENNPVGQDVLEGENQTQPLPNISERANNERLNENKVIQQTEENVILNRNRGTNITIEGQPTGENPVQTVEQRTEQAQIRQIEHTNAAAANAPQRPQIANAALNQENQLGANLDIVG